MTRDLATQPAALQKLLQPWRGCAWRMVESQHVASTMKLARNHAEQALLEILLEEGKPPQAIHTDQLDYLLASPFRYPPYPSGSRFRASTDPGVFYGAETVRTACAELGYWRWRFLCDSPALNHLNPVSHTAFAAQIACEKSLQLHTPPLDAYALDWQHPSQYNATQQVARHARQAGADGLRYQSVRDPQGAWCIALFSPLAFAARKPEALMQTWWLRADRERVVWRRDTAQVESWEFETALWRAS